MDATIEGRELDPEDLDTMIIDGAPVGEQVRLSYGPTNITTNSSEGRSHGPTG